MTERNQEPDTPRWLRLAAAARAEPESDTLARVRGRLAQASRRGATRGAEPAWVLWLARPSALAASAALLMVSAWAGSTWLSLAGAERGDDSSLTSALLGEDGSYGFRLDAGDVDGAATAPGAAGADSGRLSR